MRCKRTGTMAGPSATADGAPTPPRSPPTATGAKGARTDLAERGVRAERRIVVPPGPPLADGVRRRAVGRIGVAAPLDRPDFAEPHRRLEAALGDRSQLLGRTAPIVADSDL